MSDRVTISSLKRNQEGRRVERELIVTFDVHHGTEGRDGTSLDLKMSLTKNCAGWKAKMHLDEIPHFDNPDDAAKKLGEWMERASIAIKNGKFNDINLMDLQE